MASDDARNLAKQFLALDDSILAVILTDEKGVGLAYVSRDDSETRHSLSEEEIRRIGTVEFLGVKLAPRPGQDAGEFEYAAYVYQRFKVLITQLRTPPWVVGLKLTRSSNLEYVLRLLREHT